MMQSLRAGRGQARGVYALVSHRGGLALAAAGLLASCAHHAAVTTTHTKLPALPPLAVDSGRATPRISGPVSTSTPQAKVTVSTSVGVLPALGKNLAPAPGGSVTLDFADTDIREVASQILGTTLHLTYTIDPAVHGKTDQFLLRFKKPG